jgi:hypothetical protein
MTSTPSDIAALEAAVMQAAPEDAPGVASILSPPEAAPDAGAEALDLPPESDLISPEVWAEQWGALHDMAGGMVQMRTGNPCPLGDQARSAGGHMAAQAVYTLMASTPFLADMFLSSRSTFLGQVMVIGMHGFACVQIVKASALPPAVVAA